MRRMIAVAVLCVGLSTWASSANDRAALTSEEIFAKIAVKRPPTAEGQSATQLPDGKWLLAGGRDGAGNITSRLVLVDRMLNNPTQLSARLANPRAGHTATVLADGSVLILGGIRAAGQPVAELERYSPETQQVEVIGDVGVEARAQHSATLLMDGRILIAGGVDVSALVRRDAQLLDPDTWRVEALTNEMSSARFAHLAALLPSDEVLLWGGQNQDQEVVTSVTLYERSSGRFSRLEDAKFKALLSAPYAGSAPRVNASLPKTGDTGVAVDTRIVLRFSKPLAPEGLNAQTVTLIGPGGVVATTIAAAENGLLLFATPVAELLPGSNYTLFVQGARDAQNRVLPFTAIGFETAAMAAQIPPPASTSPTPMPEEVLDDEDGELWLPGARNLTGVWRSGKAAQSVRMLPKRGVLAKKLYGKSAKDELPAAPAGVTAIAGQVLKLNSTPLANVTLSIGAQKTMTDGNGEFLLANIPGGTQTLVIDGGTADKGKRHYGRYEYRASIEAGKTNALPFVIWMTRLDARHEAGIAAPTRQETVITNPRIPGLELRIPAGTVIRDAQGSIVTQIGMTAIPVDQPPFPLPQSFVPVYFTIQPGGAHLQGLSVQAAKGARLIYPNFSDAQSGSRMDFWNYDSQEKGWYVYGQGTVSADGKQIVPDDGVVIYEFSGAMIALPNTAPPEGPPPDGCKEGDPVDCFTGLFLEENTDLLIRDVIPIAVRRSYRPRDSVSRAFGIGTNLSYDLFLIGDTTPWTYQELILPDGGRVRYTRTSSGTAATDAVYASTSTPGAFYGSTIRWNTTSGTGWWLTLKDGTVYTFPDAYQSSSARCSTPTSMRDRNGNTVTFARDSNCNLTTVTSPKGRQIHLTYNTANRITQIADDIGRTVTYQYDGSGRLTSATDADNKTESYTYDSQHRMLTVTDKRGNVMVTNVYDANGRVTQQTYADSTTSSFSYTLDSNNRVTQTDYTNERGIVKRMQFNAAGLPTWVTLAVGTPEQQVLSFDRNSTTNLVSSQTDALGRVTSYQYDSKGNTTQITHLTGTADETSWNYTYEAKFSQIASVTDPLNHTTSYSYDAYGNRTSIVDALGHTTSFAYDESGRPTATTRYLGSSALTTSYTYNASDLASVTDPLSRTTHFYTDAVGRLVTVKDPLGNKSSITYDPLDRVSQATDGLGQSVASTYDGNDNLLTFEDGEGNTTQFAYDTRNRLSSKTDPLTHAESYLYDAAGNLSRVTDRKGQVTGYGYDALDRRTSAGFGATTSAPTSFASTVIYGWDAGGRLIEATDSISGTVARDFDGLNRLIEEQTPQGQIDYTYYANGLRQTMTVQGQTSVGYSYDDADRLTQISQGSTTVGFTYDSIDRRATLTLPNGIQVTYGYDDASQLTGLSYQNGSTSLGDLTYGYDAAGRRTSMSGSLAQVNLPAAVTTTSYDAANRVNTWAGQTLGYDVNGALTSDTGSSTLTYMWDERERLKQIQDGSTIIASFQYDAFNRRTGKTINSVSTNFLHDGWQIVQELSGTTPTANLLTGQNVDEIFRRTAGGTIEDFLSDALGSTIALTTASGSIQTNYSYEPYGKTTMAGASSTNAYQYTGRENDGGLYYYRNRYYSSAMQRFVSEDPIGLTGGQNIYVYTAGNPIRLADPLGLRGCDPSFWEEVLDWLKSHESLSLSFNAGTGAIGVGGNVSVGAEGITGNAGVGWGIGWGASATLDTSFGSSSGWGITAGVAGGGGIGGAASGTVSTGGVSATGGVGFGVGVGGSATIGYTGTIVSWED